MTETSAAIGADALLELAAIVYGGETLQSVLDRVVGVAVRTLPGADSVSVTLIRDEEPCTAAFSGQLALDADEMQYERGYGPCMDAGRAGVVLRVDDMRTEERWPDYAVAVSAHGVLSSLSVPLPIQDRYIGALNIYATEPDAFGENVVAAGQLIASYAAVAVHNAQTFTRTAELAQELTRAMASRAVIEQAKGIVMHERRCTADEAFALLTRVSQQANIKLRDIAAEMVAQTARPSSG
jgi:GAF domain-containing protein